MDKNNKPKKAWYKRVWIWIGVIVVFAATSSAIGNKQPDASTTSNSNATNSNSASSTPKKEAVTKPKAPSIPTEYTSALESAKGYATTMHMSKQGIYDQLTSAYGEKFTAEAAQYAIDHVQADWNANALASAKQYQDTMHMSPAAIHDQLTSAAGEKFTQVEADYAIAHLAD